MSFLNLGPGWAPEPPLGAGTGSQLPAWPPFTGKFGATGHRHGDERTRIVRFKLPVRRRQAASLGVIQARGSASDRGLRLGASSETSDSESKSSPRASTLRVARARSAGERRVIRV